MTSSDGIGYRYITAQFIKSIFIISKHIESSKFFIARIVITTTIKNGEVS